MDDLHRLQTKLAGLHVVAQQQCRALEARERGLDSGNEPVQRASVRSFLDFDLGRAEQMATLLGEALESVNGVIAGTPKNG